MKKEAPQQNKTAKLKRKRKTRRPAVYFFVSMFLTLAVAGGTACLFVVYHNSQDIGWSSGGTALAFSSSSHKLNLTVLGKYYSVSTRPFEEARRVYASMKQNETLAMPAPHRFLRDLLRLGAAGISALERKTVGELP